MRAGRDDCGCERGVLINLFIGETPFFHAKTRTFSYLIKTWNLQEVTCTSKLTCQGLQAPRLLTGVASTDRILSCHSPASHASLMRSCLQLGQATEREFRDELNYTFGWIFDIDSGVVS